MNRVVITGLGVISCLGNDSKEVLSSLKASKSGLSINQDYVDNGMRCHVSGQVNPDLTTIDRKMLRFMSETSAYAFLSTKEAIADSGLSEEQISSNDVGVIVGSGTGSSRELKNVVDTAREKGIKRVGPYAVTRTMGNTTSAAISTFFQTKGVSFSIASACSTSLHCISYGYDLIKSGRQNIVIAGGSEDDHWTGAMMFDAMGALSTKNNEFPTESSKPYDLNRDGFIPSGGGGIVILEEYESAKKRGAHIAEDTKVINANRIDNYWEITLNNNEKIKSKILNNAAGPWINETVNNVLKINAKKSIRLVRGSHIITKKLYEQEVAFTLQNDDNRIVFVIPYKDEYSLIGTTEVDVNTPDNPSISDEEKIYLIDSNQYIESSSLDPIHWSKKTHETFGKKVADLIVNRIKL